MSYGFASGVIDNEKIRYCPYCGKRIGVYYADGTAECTECKIRFGVIGGEEEEPWEGEKRYEGVEAVPILWVD